MAHHKESWETRGLDAHIHNLSPQLSEGLASPFGWFYSWGKIPITPQRLGGRAREKCLPLLGIKPWSNYRNGVIIRVTFGEKSFLEGIPNLTWWGLCDQTILGAMLAIVELLIGPPMPDRSKVMTQTKGDTLVLQVGGWVWADNPTP